MLRRPGASLFAVLALGACATTQPARPVETHTTGQPARAAVATSPAASPSPPAGPYDPEGPRAVAALIEMYAAHSQWDLAEQVCARADAMAVPESQIERDDFISALNTCGVVAMRLGRPAPATARFERVTLAEPEAFEAWMNLGAVRIRFRDFSGARDAYQHAVALRESSYDASMGVGNALRDAGEASEAVRWYERTIALDPTQPYAYFNAARAYDDIGDIPAHQNALRMYEQFLLHVGGDARFAPAIEIARNHLRNIGSIHELRAVGSPPEASP